MPGLGRRLRLQIPLAVIVAAAGLFPAAIGAQAAGTPQLALTVSVGYHGGVKFGAWMPVTVDLTNNGPAIDATLEVQSDNGGNGAPQGYAVYRMPVSLAQGATKHLRTYLEMDSPSTVTVRIVQSGRILAGQSATASSNVYTALIGVLSDRPTALDTLATLRVGGSQPGVEHLTLQDISDSATVLRAFDLLAIDDFATDTLTTGQRVAIADYVSNGGALLIGTGGSWHKTLAGLPQGILPMTVDGSTTLFSRQSFGGLSPVEIATGSVSGGAVWLAQDNQPLLVEKTSGAGTVELATFDWAADPVAGWSGASDLLREVMVRASFNSLSAQPVGGFGGAGTSASSKSNAVITALSNLPALDLPSLWLTGSLVLLYVLLVGPINYFFLRAIRRRALSWVTVPLIALIAAGGAYGGATLLKGRSVQANQITILYLQPGSDHAAQETYDGVLTPTRGDYQVAVTTAHQLISPIANYNGGFPSSAGLIQVDLAGGGITMPGMTAFTLRGFATESVTNAPQLVGTARLVNGNLVGTIQNLSSTQFTDAVVIAGDGYQILRALPPGTTTAYSVKPAVYNPSGAPPATATIYSNFNYGPPPGLPTDAEREAETKSQIISMLPIGAFKGITTYAAPILVAWTRQSFQEITVNGVHPHTFAETAVVLPLVLGQTGPGTLPAGVVPGRLVDLTGDTNQSGPPGLLYMQSGTATYEFTPGLAAGLHLANASVTVANPFFAKGAPVPVGGSGSSGTGTIRAEVWDWSRSAWVPVTYQDGVATAIPDAGVNASTGEVRMRMSSDGPFQTGGLTLTGTVQ